MLEYICYPSKKKVRISKIKYIRDRDGNYTQLSSLNTQFIRIWMPGVLYPSTQWRLASEVRRAPWRRMWKILRLNRPPLQLSEEMDSSNEEALWSNNWATLFACPETWILKEMSAKEDFQPKMSSTGRPTW